MPNPVQPQVSNLKKDEVVQFFRTSSWFDSERQEWNVPIHAWVYEPQLSRSRKKVLSSSLKTKYGLKLSEENKSNFDRRVNLLLSDNARNKRLVIKLGKHLHQLPKTDPRGHVQAILTLPLLEVPTDALLSGKLPYSVVLSESDLRSFSGETQLIQNEGISIISDIDDTVKISHVTDRKRLMEQTFYRDFEAVAGMAKLYQSLSAQKIPLHFVSSSPWQLYQPLQEFFTQKNFPESTVSLKTIRFKDRSILNLFKSGAKTKPQQIQPILDRYPKRKFMLIGDSGEADPEVYLSMLAKHPAQIMAIFIRSVTTETDTDPRYQLISDTIGADQFLLFESSKEAEKRLIKLGVL